MGIPERFKTAIVFAFLLAAQLAASQENAQGHHERSGTATIRGTVAVSSRPDTRTPISQDPIRERYSTHGAPDSMEMPGGVSANEVQLSERVVLYLEGSTLDMVVYPVPEKHPTLDQTHLEFHPRVLPILSGTTVDFPNRDNLFHNVFSYSQTKEFDLGRYPKNDSRSVTFEQPGVVRVYCDIHSHMNATILVLQNPYFTVPAVDGTFTLRHIPEGTYTLVVWYERDVVERRPVELKAGETLDLDFTF